MTKKKKEAEVAEQSEANDAAPSNLETKEIEISLDVPLTDAEIIALADLAVAANRRLAAETMDFNRAKDEHKDRVGGLQTEIADALLTVERRKTSKRVKCQEVWDYAAKTVRVLHGEEEVAARTMSAAEIQADADRRQLKMFPADDGDGLSPKTVDNSDLDVPQSEGDSPTA